jgi:hypothetical protein
LENAMATLNNEEILQLYQQLLVPWEEAET